MSEKIDPKDLAPSPSALFDMFPEAKLTMRDRLPTNMLLLYTFLNVNKAIRDIKFSPEEIREIILAVVAMIPDELRDELFIDELNAAQNEIWVDVRPIFCTTTASVEYCQRKGIPAYIKVPQLNYFDVYHAVFNLLMRKHMLLKITPKEIMTGKPAIFEETEEE